MTQPKTVKKLVEENYPISPNYDYPASLHKFEVYLQRDAFKAGYEEARKTPNTICNCGRYSFSDTYFESYGGIRHRLDGPCRMEIGFVEQQKGE